MPSTLTSHRLAIAWSLGWICTGTLWFVQAFVPWTGTGTLSHSSTIDASSLIRSGAVSSLAPSIAGWLLMVLPAVGLVLFATAFRHDRLTRSFRIVSAVIGTIITAAVTHYLAHFQINNFGPGALLAWLGCAACVINIVATVRINPR